MRLKAWTIAVSALLVATACRRPPPPEPRVALLTGEIIWREAQSPELRVRIKDGAAERVLQCEFSKDSEIYLNDRFAPLEESLVGDQVELRGEFVETPGAAPSDERFAVETMLIKRVTAPTPLPAPAAALLDANTPTLPASQQQPTPPEPPDKTPPGSAIRTNTPEPDQEAPYAS
ncbi:MAG: hypothetical protein KDA32_11410 [Phycisphaerales bacterium]|nr:hypothetical protein [Phycisphaerales bacterium]